MLNLLRPGPRAGAVAAPAGAVLGALRAAEVPVARMLELASAMRWSQLVLPVLPGRAGLLSLSGMDEVLERALVKGCSVPAGRTPAGRVRRSRAS